MNISDLSSNIRAWRDAEKDHRAVIMIAVDSSRQPLIEANFGIDGNRRLLVEALKCEVLRDDTLLTLLNQALSELSEGIQPIEIHLN